jgi:hypothetical protein
MTERGREEGAQDSTRLSDEEAEAATQTESASAPEALERDIDVILARLETGIARERKALDELLDRLTHRAAA